MEDTLYISNGGRVACAEHGGQYLKSALAADPTATTIITPLDHWVVGTTDELDGLGCETCNPWF